MTDTKKEEIKMFDNIIENTKRNISSATLMAIAITILESYFLIKGNFPISYTILCAILFYVGWVVFCSIALSILKTIIALILWIIEEIKKAQTCTNQEVKPSELPHPIFDDDIVIKKFTEEDTKNTYPVDEDF